jgi:hypothetical protein
LQPDIKAGAAAIAGTEPETFDESEIDDIPLYPSLPEQARIGEISEDNEQMFNPIEEGE